jgi:hypothetical protein
MPNDNPYPSTPAGTVNEPADERSVHCGLAAVLALLAFLFHARSLSSSLASRYGVMNPQDRQTEHLASTRPARPTRRITPLLSASMVV